MAGGEFPIQDKTTYFNLKDLLEFLGHQMALMKENINWLQQNGHTSVTKQRERFLLLADGFQNSLQRASKDPLMYS